MNMYIYNAYVYIYNIYIYIYIYIHIYIYIYMYIYQCPKLSMHPAPGVHIFRAGCTIFKEVHPECAHFFSHLSLLHIRRVHSFTRSAPGGCKIQKLNFGQCIYMYIYIYIYIYI